jgi:hypothetical protein
MPWIDASGSVSVTRDAAAAAPWEVLDEASDDGLDDAWASDDDDEVGPLLSRAWGTIEAYGPRSAEAVSAWLSVAALLVRVPSVWPAVYGAGAEGWVRALEAALRGPATAVAAGQVRAALRAALRAAGRAERAEAELAERSQPAGVVDLARLRAAAPSPPPGVTAPSSIAVRGPADRRVGAWSAAVRAAARGGR